MEFDALAWQSSKARSGEFDLVPEDFVGAVGVERWIDVDEVQARSVVIDDPPDRFGVGVFGLEAGVGAGLGVAGFGGAGGEVGVEFVSEGVDADEVGGAVAVEGVDVGGRLGAVVEGGHLWELGHECEAFLLDEFLHGGAGVAGAVEVIGPEGADGTDGIADAGGGVLDVFGPGVLRRVEEKLFAVDFAGAIENSAGLPGDDVGCDEGSAGAGRIAVDVEEVVHRQRIIRGRGFGTGRGVELGRVADQAYAERDEVVVGLGVDVVGGADLAEVAEALGCGGGFARLDEGGKGKADEQGDDADDDQKLDEREGLTSGRRTL